MNRRELIRHVRVGMLLTGMLLLTASVVSQARLPSGQTVVPRRAGYR